MKYFRFAWPTAAAVFCVWVCCCRPSDIGALAKAKAKDETTAPPATADATGGGAPSDERRKKPLTVAGVPLGQSTQQALSIRCQEPGHRINPMVYGVASSPRLDSPIVELGATAARWGGNASSRYNWKLGNAWNAASDWFFRNTNYSGSPRFDFDKFLDYQRQHGLKTALSVPMIGWVAKDTESASFPVSVFGAQQRTNNHGSGNGKSPRGDDIEPGPATRTSVRASPEFVGEWVQHLRKRDAGRGERGIDQYILDNEPMLWNTTHRDVHPEPLGYDELLQRSIAYGSAVRRADPEAVIAGPALWGWTAYFYSALDGATGWAERPDRRAHGDVPLLPWYLSKMREHEEKTGERILDVVDVHFYPQARGVDMMTNGRTDADGAALRLRSTRALWDPGYRDESWIKEEIRLLPRLQEWIDENYPGRGISIGEYNFGAEQHISGGLAVAEALGRFGEKGITSAFYWRYPAPETPAFWAFRAFRNYDGAGARFQDWHVAAGSDTDIGGSAVSLFASRDDATDRVVAVALNLGASQPVQATIALQGCGVLPKRRVFTFVGGKQGFAQQPQDATADAAGASGTSADRVEATLAPYSMTIFEFSSKTAPLAAGSVEPSQGASQTRAGSGSAKSGRARTRGARATNKAKAKAQELVMQNTDAGSKQRVVRRLSDAQILEREPGDADGWWVAGQLDGAVFVAQGGLAGQGALAEARDGQPGWLELVDGTFHPAQSGRAPNPPYVKGIMTEHDGFRPSSAHIVY